MSSLMVVGKGGGPLDRCFLMASGVLLVASSKHASSCRSCSWTVKVHRLTAWMLMPWWHVSKVGPGASLWLTMLSASVVLLNLRKDGVCVLSSSKNVWQAMSRVDLLGCLYSSFQMGARRCCSSHVSPLMPSRKQVRFSAFPSGMAGWCRCARWCSGLTSGQRC